jgi:hypothetical protein
MRNPDKVLGSAARRLKRLRGASDRGAKGSGMGELLTEEHHEVVELVADINRAAEALPVEEREAYDAAQESVVEARRSAEVHEGLLQVD